MTETYEITTGSIEQSGILSAVISGRVRITQPSAETSGEWEADIRFEEPCPDIQESVFVMLNTVLNRSTITGKALLLTLEPEGRGTEYRARLRGVGKPAITRATLHAV